MDTYSVIITSLIGLAYPILIQVIPQIKETSETALAEFEDEFIYIWFRYHLYFSLFSLLFWGLKFSTFKLSNGIDYFEVVITILLVFNSGLILILFLLLINKIFIYLVEEKYFDYRRARHNEEV